MMNRTTLTSFALALASVASLTAQSGQGLFDVYIARVKPDKRVEFDAVTKKFVAANRQHKGDTWVAYQVEYGEQNTLYFVSVRNNYGDIDEGVKSFRTANTASFGASGMEKLLADNDRQLISSRGEIRVRRPDLSANLPATPSALNAMVGKSRFLRTVIVRTRPGRGPEEEALLRKIKEATEKQTPNYISGVSQSSVGAPLGIYYITNFGDSLAALQSPKTLPALLGERGYQDFLKVNGEATLGAEIIIGRFLPELSNPPAEIAAADPAFWNPKPPPTPKPKAAEDKKLDKK